jgi:uncharacterized membrane protein YhiD involved in acid resistance
MLPNLEILARLLLAALLGRAAGIRTHMLVCVGRLPDHDRLVVRFH